MREFAEVAEQGDLVALLEAGFKVWKSTADAKKRGVLGNALRNVQGGRGSARVTKCAARSPRGAATFRVARAK